MIALAALSAAFTASLAIERLAAIRDAPPPALAALPARFAVVSLLFLLWLGLFGRPLLAATATAITLAVLCAISLHKRQLVAEPLVFSDFALLGLVVRHPDLYYLGFARDPRFVAGVLLLAAALATWLWLEPPLLGVISGLTLSIVAVAASVAALRWPPFAPGLARAVPRPQLERQVGRWGLLLTLVVHALRWRAEIAIPYPPSPAEPAAVGPERVVVVQLESFADPARLGLSSEPLPGLARARRLAVAHGPLRVPAHGAFTMRSEYAVLTGLDADESGFRQFDPYLSSRGGVPPTLASRLAARGYRTVFIHPFRAGFFNRANVVPRLGFTAAVWEEDFAGAPRLGPYVSDEAVAERVLREAETGPALVYAVTMENHGPWTPGRLPGETDPTRQYLRHLHGSDAAIERLLDGFAALPGATLLCLFGDHPPILPGIDRSIPPETDYVIVKLGDGTKPGAGHAPADPLTVAELGRKLVALCREASTV